MKVTLYTQVEISDEVLLQQFGDQLPVITAQHGIEAKLALTVKETLESIPGCRRAAVIPLLDLLHGV